jgi:hypothetical protein
MSRIGVRPAFSAASTIASIPAHEYPGDVGSVAAKPAAGVDGAMLRQLTPRRTYVAPAALVMANALAF